MKKVLEDECDIAEAKPGVAVALPVGGESKVGFTP
jgi:hypothetical protein